MPNWDYCVDCNGCENCYTDSEKKEMKLKNTQKKTKQLRIYVASVTTESFDHYVYAFRKKPTYEQVAALVCKHEGEIEELQWYIDTCSISIDLVRVE